MAQWLAQTTHNRLVAGPTPAGPTYIWPLVTNCIYLSFLRFIQPKQVVIEYVIIGANYYFREYFMKETMPILDEEFFHIITIQVNIPKRKQNQLVANLFSASDTRLSPWF